jgi:hypothetical protein
MDIQQLAVVVTDHDLNQLARKQLPDDFPVENVKFAIGPEGLAVTGEFPLFVSVSFHTLWQLGVRDGKVTARLMDLRAFGLPVTVFKSMILKILAESARKIDGLAYEDDLLVADVDRLALREGLPLRLNLRSIECMAGQLFVRAGESVSCTPEQQ